MVRGREVGRLVGRGGGHELSGADVARAAAREGHLAHAVGDARPLAVARRVDHAAGGLLVHGLVQLRLRGEHLLVAVRVLDAGEGQGAHFHAIGNEPLQVADLARGEGAPELAVLEGAGAGDRAHHAVGDARRVQVDLLTLAQVQAGQVQSVVQAAKAAHLEAPDASTLDRHPVAVGQAHVDATLHREAERTDVDFKLLFRAKPFFVERREDDLRRGDHAHAGALGVVQDGLFLDGLRDHDRPVPLRRQHGPRRRGECGRTQGKGGDKNRATGGGRRAHAVSSWGCSWCPVHGR